MKKSTNRLKTFIKSCMVNTAVVVFSVTVALVGTEIHYRLKYPKVPVFVNEREKFSSYDQRIGWINRAGAVGTMEGEDFNVSVSINHLGLRDKGYDHERSSHFRILVLGDSFTWGFGVEQDERFTDLMEKGLEKTEVINMSCSGYGQDQELLLFQREGVKYKPDLVIINVHFDSDIWNNYTSRSYGYNKPVFLYKKNRLVLTNVPVPHASRGEQVSKWMTEHLRSWPYIKIIPIKRRSLDDYFIDFINTCTGDDSGEVVKSNIPAEQLMVYLLEELHSVCNQNGCELLVLLSPNILPGGQKIMPDMSMEHVKEELKKKAIPFLELEIAFQKYFKDHAGSHVTFPTDRHWNTKGHKVVADYLLTNISENNKNRGED